MKKKFILTTVILLAVFLLGACSLQLYSRTALHEELLEHMYQKYGIEFSIYRYHNRGSGSYLLEVYPTGGDPVYDIAHLSWRGNQSTGEYSISDTFFGVLIREEVETEITNLLSDFPIPFRVFYPTTIAYFNNIFDSTKNLNDFLTWRLDYPYWGFDITVVLSLNNLDEADAYANLVFDSISGSAFSGLFTVVVLPEEGFVRLTRTNKDALIVEYHGQTATIGRNILRSVRSE